jgi:hypothetical protein
VVDGNATSGLASACCCTTAQMWLSSVEADLRNLRRAGVCANKSATSIVVPGRAALRALRWKRPPSAHLRPSPAPARALAARTRDTAAMLGRLAPEAQCGEAVEIVEAASLLVAWR